MYFLYAIIFTGIAYAQYIVVSNVEGIDNYYRLDKCLQEDNINEYWRRYEIFNDTHYVVSNYENELRCKSRIPDSQNYGILKYKDVIDPHVYAFCTIYYYDASCTEYISLPIKCYSENTCISDPNGGSVIFHKNINNTVSNIRYADKNCENIHYESVVIQEGCEYVMSPITGYIQYIISNSTTSIAVLHVALILLILFFMNY